MCTCYALLLLVYRKCLEGGCSSFPHVQFLRVEYFPFRRGLSVEPMEATTPFPFPSPPYYPSLSALCLSPALPNLTQSTQPTFLRSFMYGFISLFAYQTSAVWASCFISKSQFLYGAVAEESSGSRFNLPLCIHISLAKGTLRRLSRRIYREKERGEGKREKQTEGLEGEEGRRKAEDAREATLMEVLRR